MAENERVVIFKVDTREGVTSVRDLKDNIKKLKESLADAQIGSEEYSKTMNELKVNQNALRDAMHATTTSMEDLAAAAAGANVEFDKQGKLVNAEAVSYNELVHTLANLKEAWRATTDEQQRADLAKQINSVNNRLKEMDASVGTYKRNVGAYQNIVSQLGNALGNLVPASKAATGGIGGMTMGLKAMSGTPVIAILGVLVNVLTKITGAMRTSEENTKALTAAMAPLQSIGDAVTKVLQGLGKTIVWLVDQFGKLTQKIFGVNKATQDRIGLAEKENALLDKQRSIQIENAKAEKDIAELRAKASDRANYTAKQRIEFLEQAGEMERQMAERNKDLAQQEYEALKLRTSLTQSSKEELDALAAAEAKAIKAETDYYTTVRSINSGISAARRQEEKDARDAAKAVADAARAKLDAETMYQQQLLDVATEGSEEQLAIQNELSRLQYEKAKADAEQKILDEETLNRTLLLLQQAYQRDTLKNQEAFDEKQRDAELLAIANRRDALEQGSEAYLAASVELAEKTYDTLTQKQGESDDQFLARRIAAYNALLDAQTAYDDAVEERERLAVQNRMEEAVTGSQEYLARAVELKKYELDTLHRLEGESDEAFRSRQLAAEKAYVDARKALWQSQLDTMNQIAAATSGILGSIADMYEANTNGTKKDAERIKNLRIASATIDMLQGAVTAYSTAQKLGPPQGPIIGAINAAAVTAAGLANIAKIKATKVSTSAAASTTPAATITAPAVPATSGVQLTRSLTGASEEDRLDRMADPQRVQVYILDSDLQANRESNRVRVAETEF